MAEARVDVRRTSDMDLVESLVPDHPHLTRPLADREDKQYIVARVDDEPVGTCWVRPMTDRTGVFGGLWVDPDSRGHGLGGRIMDAGLGELAERGARLGMLGVHLDNEEGLALARSRGFRTVSFVPGRSTGLGSLVADWVERVSPLPFPDRSTRLMTVWLGEDRKQHSPDPALARIEAASVDGEGTDSAKAEAAQAAADTEASAKDQ